MVNVGGTNTLEALYASRVTCTEGSQQYTLYTGGGKGRGDEAGTTKAMLPLHTSPFSCAGHQKPPPPPPPPPSYLVIEVLRGLSTHVNMRGGGGAQGVGGGVLVTSSPTAAPPGL